MALLRWDTVSDEYTDYVLEQLEASGRVTAKRLFGGVGLSRGAVHFALIMNGTLYFAVDDETRPRYEAAGMGPFAYDTRKRRVQVRRYYELPEDVLLDRDALRVWMDESLAAAERARRPKRKRGAKRRPRRTGRVVR